MKTNKSLVKVFVEQLANKNQFVIWYRSNDEEVVAFQSYRSLIAIYHKGDYLEKRPDVLEINWDKWDYSKTTLKHLKMFINGYTSFNYETKQQFAYEIIHNDDILSFNE